MLRENTAQLVETLKRELELKEQKLQDELHHHTLEYIFIKERIYKLIEKCKTNEAVVAAVYAGFKPFKWQLGPMPLTDGFVQLPQARLKLLVLIEAGLSACYDAWFNGGSSKEQFAFGSVQIVSRI